MLNIEPVIRHKEENRPLVVAGPCSAETRAQVVDTARAVADIGADIFRAGLWKPRTLPGGFEGVGAEGLDWLKEVKSITGLPVVTEVACRAHVLAACQNDIDILWIGARTTTNPFAVQEIADAIKETGKDIAVMIKNPVNPDIDLWIGAIQRIYNAGVRRLAAIHRGFSSYSEKYYRNSPIWRIALELKRRFPELSVFSDPSHIGGRRELIAPLATQAIDMGFEGLFIETHVDPGKALSDSAQQITPSELKKIMDGFGKQLRTDAQKDLDELRSRIDRLDSEMFDILRQRMETTLEIAKYKKGHNMPIVQPTRYDHVMKTRVENAVAMGFDREFARSLIASIHEESVRRQLDIYNANSAVNQKD